MITNVGEWLFETNLQVVIQSHTPLSHGWLIVLMEMTNLNKPCLLTENMLTLVRHPSDEIMCSFGKRYFAVYLVYVFGEKLIPY